MRAAFALPVGDELAEAEVAAVAEGEGAVDRLVERYAESVAKRNA